MQLIDRNVAKHLIETGAVRRVSIKAEQSALVIVFETQLKEFALKESKGGGARLFKTVSGAISVVVDALEVRRFDVDLGQYVGDQPRLV